MSVMTMTGLGIWVGPTKLIMYMAIPITSLKAPSNIFEALPRLLPLSDMPIPFLRQGRQDPQPGMGIGRARPPFWPDLK